MSLERYVGIHPDPRPSGCFLVISDKAAPNYYLRCYLPLQVLHVAPSVGEECRFCFWTVNLQLPLFCPVDGHSGAGRECSDNWVYFASRCHPSDIFLEGLTFDSRDPLFNQLFMSPDVQIAMRIGDTGELCGMPGSTGCLSITLPAISISTVSSVRTLAIHRMRSPSIPLPIIVWISLPLPMLGKAVLMSIRCMPVMWSSLPAACALSTTIAAGSIADRLFVLPYLLLLSSPLLSASSASSSATTFSTTLPMQLSREMKRYTFGFV